MAFQAEPPPEQPAPVFNVDFNWDFLIDSFRAMGIEAWNFFTGWLSDLPSEAATNTTPIIRDTWDALSLSGISFLVRTPPSLTYDLVNRNVGDVRPLLEAVVGLAFILAAVSYAGHRFLGWGSLDTRLGRIGVTVVLVGSSFRLTTWSIDLLNVLISGVAATVPSMPDAFGGLHPLVVAGALVLWLIFGLRLGLQMAKRIVWLVTLQQLAPLALMTYIHPSSAWIATTWGRLWIGWLIGQVLVVVMLAASIQLIAAGGMAGLLLSLGIMLAAHDAVNIFAPRGTLGSVSVSAGVGPVRVNL